MNYFFIYIHQEQVCDHVIVRLFHGRYAVLSFLFLVKVLLCVKIDSYQIKKLSD